MGLRGIRMISPTGSEACPEGFHAGFSLMELLTVILILSIMVGISVPRFSRTFNHLQVQVFAHDVAKLLTYASRRAIARGEMVSFHYDRETKRYWLARKHGDSREGESVKIASKLNRISMVPETLSVKSSAREVTFYPDGRADPFEMVIVDKSTDGYRLVTDIWTGRAKLHEIHGR